MNDTDVLPVIGPLHAPAHPAGVTWPGCNHQAPNSCARCDGTDAERYWRPEHDRASVLPPCMRPERSTP